MKKIFYSVFLGFSIISLLTACGDKSEDAASQNIGSPVEAPESFDSSENSGVSESTEEVSYNGEYLPIDINDVEDMPELADIDKLVGSYEVNTFDDDKYFAIEIKEDGTYTFYTHYAPIDYATGLPKIVNYFDDNSQVQDAKQLFALKETGALMPSYGDYVFSAYLRMNQYFSYNSDGQFNQIFPLENNAIDLYFENDPSQYSPSDYDTSTDMKLTIEGDNLHLTRGESTEGYNESVIDANLKKTSAVPTSVKQSVYQTKFEAYNNLPEELESLNQFLAYTDESIDNNIYTFDLKNANQGYLSDGTKLDEMKFAYRKYTDIGTYIFATDGVNIYVAPYYIEDYPEYNEGPVKEWNEFGIYQK